MARIAGKLSAATMGWNKAALAKATAPGLVAGKDEKGEPVTTVNADHRVKLGRIVGIATGLHHAVNNDTGEIATALKGQFRGLSTATATDTGKPIVVTAGRLYLGSGLQAMLEGALETAKAADKSATVSFAIDLFAVPSLNLSGYSFEAETKIDTAEVDPLDLLMKAAGETDADAETPEAEAPAPDGDKPSDPETKGGKGGKGGAGNVAVE